MSGFDRAELDALLDRFEQAGPSASDAGPELCEAFERWSNDAGKLHPELESIRADVQFAQGMHSTATGDYEAAIAHLHDAVETSQKAEHTRRQIYSLCSLAVCLEYVGMQEQASDRILESLSLADELGQDRLRAVASHSLTALYQAQGAYELMLESAMRTQAIADDIGERALQLRAYSAVSLAFAHLGRGASAVDWLMRGIALIDDSTQPFVETLLYLNLVFVHRCNGEQDRAALLAEEYVDRISELPAHHAAVAYVDLAELYIECGDLDRAEAMLHSTSGVADSNAIKAHLPQYFNVAADLYEARGDHERALAMLREHVDVERDLQGRQARIRMVAIERHFAADLAARTDELHHLRTVELVEKNEQLARLISEKEAVLDVVVNDLRNPLAAVVILTDLLLSKPRDGIDQQAVEVVESIRGASVEMRSAVDRLVTPDHIELSDAATEQDSLQSQPTHPTVG